MNHQRSNQFESHKDIKDYLNDLGNIDKLRSLSDLKERFDNFDEKGAVSLYGLCDRRWLDFGPLVLKLFRYRGLTDCEIVFLNCARWMKVAGKRLVEADEREHRRLHYVIVGKPDGGGDPPGGDPDTGPDGFEMSVGDLIRVAHKNEDEEPETPPAPLVSPPIPSLPSPEVKPQKAKPLARSIWRQRGLGID